jgi:hypothetical protein|tara:strand:+ start:38 stop:445 length:408 start_codon:yes stop_codon:yes gene_type:complete
MTLKKPTPSQKGLKKLAPSIRNKMGYLSKGGVPKKANKGMLIITIGAAKKKKTDKKKKVVKAYAGMSVSRDMATNPQSVKSQKQASNSAANRGKGLMTILTAAIKGNKPTFVYKGKTYDTQAVKDKLAKQKTASS